jgi:uncharacterized protein YbaR (Trm112 family)
MAIEVFPSLVCRSSSIIHRRSSRGFYYKRYNKWRNTVKLYAFVRYFDASFLSEVPVMAISKELLDILVCPACRAKVELKPDGSGLKCVECKRVYPVRDDIPVMLDEATFEAELPNRPPASQ